MAPYALDLRPLSLLSLLFYLAIWTRIAQGLQITFCSTQNTGSDFQAVYNQYQSNGACQDTCSQNYAFGILKANLCWCSNYAPSDQTDTASCSKKCPGFPSELCGNEDEGLFGYYLVGSVQPSGTIGGGAGQGPSASPTSSPQAPPTSASPPPPPPSSSSPSPQSSSATPSPSTTWSPTPSAIVTTVLGSIQTVIITPTIPPQSTETQVTTINAVPAKTFWDDTGKVAGTFTAVAVVIVALIGVIIWLLVRRARSRESIAIRSTSDGDNTSVTQMPYGSEKRNSKLTLATAGLGGVRRGDSHEKKSTAENTPASMSRRASIPLVHDQRLDPRALFSLDNGNASHISVASLRDDRDYSRSVLHVRNPD